MKEQISEERAIVFDKASGALWGAILGDVIGAHLEFDADVTPAKVKSAFMIVGGGKHHLEPGQPTDDTELTLSVSHALAQSQKCFNLNSIAHWMSKWYLSHPIDIGNTIRNSLPKACNMEEHQAYVMRKAAKQKSQKSESNGTLMTMIGISLWTRRLSPQDLRQAVRQYTILIHPNEVVIQSNIFYAHMISYMINNPKDEERRINAFKYAKSSFLSQKTPNPTFISWLAMIQQSFTKPELLRQQLPASKSAGWVRIAFSYAIHHLIVGKSYYLSIKQIISMKGDTDTNACIAGGLLGSYYGITKLQMEDQLEKIKKWRPNKSGRPQWLVPGKVVEELIQKIVGKGQITAKIQLKMIGSQQQYVNVKQKENQKEKEKVKQKQQQVTKKKIQNQKMQGKKKMLDKSPKKTMI